MARNIEIEEEKTPKKREHQTNEYGKICNWEIESLDAKHGDLEYIYYVWQAPGKSTWISIFEVNGHLCEHCDKYIQKDRCIFVGEPGNLIQKYNTN